MENLEQLGAVALLDSSTQKELLFVAAETVNEWRYKEDSFMSKVDSFLSLKIDIGESISQQGPRRNPR